MKLTLTCCIFCIVFLLNTSYSQQPFKKNLSLEDLSAFKPQAGNWQIVGDVLMDPTAEAPSHEKPAEQVEKKKKKEKDQPFVDHPKTVTFQGGKGILLNLNDESKKDNLITTWEHGDIELELEVMLPKGSNSGIFLQGRYEVQLFDSWGVLEPKYSDMGGIYRNWETEKDKFYPGKAPLSNPAKAPGLWQKMKIIFRAPRFDASGKKTENAKFVSVELNGVKIHDNVEVPLLTGAPIENNEKPTGPLMIQGDHGAVAFRNIQYTLMKETKVTLSPLSYKIFHGRFRTIADFMSAKPLATGTIPELSCEVVDAADQYAAIFTGTVTVPEDNTYEFSLLYAGGARVVVNGQLILDFQRADGSRYDRGSATLKAGTYPIEIYNYKDVAWVAPRLALFVKTENSYPQGFFAYNSNPPDDNPVAPIFINPGSKPKLLRAFVDFKGNGGNRLTHTIGVGDPTGVHYVYDLESGNVICSWHGDFIDATPMWHDRGDGSFRPKGAAQYFFINQPLAFLSDQTQAFPAIGKEGEFRTKGYEIEAASGRPVFKYLYKGLQINDRLYPDDHNRTLTREITIKENQNQPGLYYKLAEGHSIVALPNDLYIIGEKEYYIKMISPVKPIVRDGAGIKELILPVTGNSIVYSIIW